MFSHRILKVGVGVLDDAKKLSRDYGLFLQGCVDLRHMAARHRGLHTGYVQSRFIYRH